VTFHAHARGVGHAPVRRAVGLAALAARADPTARDKEGETPLDLAREEPLYGPRELAVLEHATQGRPR